MDREISERLTEEVKTIVPAMADRLRPALKLANRQLEALCPALMGMSRKGFVGSLAAKVKFGTWLIVLANPRKIFVMQFLAPPVGVTRREIINGCIESAIERLGHAPTPHEMLPMIDYIIETHGGKPNSSYKLDEEIVANIIGLLFAPVQHQHREQMIDWVEKLIADNICPLHVGLMGKGLTKGKMCGAWPLVLPFAPYMEHVQNLIDA